MGVVSILALLPSASGELSIPSFIRWAPSFPGTDLWSPPKAFSHKMVSFQDPKLHLWVFPLFLVKQGFLLKLLLIVKSSPGLSKCEGKKESLLLSLLSITLQFPCKVDNVLIL